MVEGGPIDVLTGDWLAELTMLARSFATLASRWLDGPDALPAEAKKKKGGELLNVLSSEFETNVDNICEPEVSAGATTTTAN